MVYEECINIDLLFEFNDLEVLCFVIYEFCDCR